MITFLILLLLIWAMVFSAKQFMQYRRIETQYDRTVVAKVINRTYIEPEKKRQPKKYNVVIEYQIDGKRQSSEFEVPYTNADEFDVGKEVEIRYAVSSNGAVHVASTSDMFKKLMYVHLGAIIVEFVVFFVLWFKM